MGDVVDLSSVEDDACSSERSDSAGDAETSALGATEATAGDLRIAETELRVAEGELQQAEEDLAQAAARCRELRLQRDEARQRLQRLKTKTQNYGHEEFPWSASLRRICEHFFKVSTFRGKQLECMNALLSGRDTMLVMPTGAGKSLCFQALGLLRDGLVVVISPLISLMQDQVFRLRGLGLRAVFLTSADTKEEQQAFTAAIKLLQQPRTNEAPRSDLLRFLYVTPERVSKSKRLMTHLEKVHKVGGLSLIVVDEAHCISQWGHDFRPDYEKLSVLKIHFATVPLLALTATATRRTADSVKESLRISSCEELRSPMDRPNLRYAVCRKPPDAKAAVAVIAGVIRRFPSGATGIVYCLSRKEAEAVSEALVSDHGVSAVFYHADMPPEQRQEAHEAWASGAAQVVVATIAFGMGVDKPDVRYVIHHSMPASLHGYYQESGRAGRDGNPAFCLLMYRAADLPRQSVMVYYKRSGLSELYAVARYCTGAACRRRAILEHFLESAPDCAGCDVCDAPRAHKRAKVEQHEEVASALFEAVKASAVAGKLLTLRQAAEATRRSVKIDLETIMHVAIVMLAAGVLVEKFSATPYSVNAYLAAGRWEPITTTLPEAEPSVPAAVASLKPPKVPAVKRSLRQAREAAARRMGVPSYTVLSDAEARLLQAGADVHSILCARRLELYGEEFTRALAASADDQ
uniref:ATP-dependent DNA helicase n=1 Tax=Oxyrrhis marina TaxID=2969 RepID=A0A7S4LPY7_OXYMA|mmetsp:Transcript_43776/g.115674  ORF Transcript_43776/g.115674 Transcript_43776/m.115674 type:complete len:692 (+) Transcript_43776:2029-4104(+)